MVTRWTMISLRELTTPAVRMDDIKRRSSGFRYWLLVPFSGVFVYASVAWMSLAMIWPAGGLRSLVRRG